MSAVMSPRRPTKEELLAAVGKTLPDVIAPGLRVLFCGINPGLYTAAIGHHFGRPGNRFWPALHAAGFTDRLLTPYEEQELLPLGYGITNVVERATATAAELGRDELIEGGRLDAVLGRQPETLGGAMVWVLPNPSGLNAHYTLEGLAEKLRELRAAVGI